MPNFPFVANDIIRYMAYGPCWVRRIHGYNAQAANVYIQLHETPPLANGTLAGNTVPNVKSLETTPANGFDYEFVNAIKLNECLLALSTTEPNYTAVGAGGGLDMTVELDSDYLATSFPPNKGAIVTIVGDLVTTLNTLQVWAEAAGSQRLLRLDVIEQLGVNGNVIISASDTVNSDVPIGRVLPIAANQTLNLAFGRRGLIPYSRDSTTGASPGTERKGCTIINSPSLKSPWAVQANSMVCRAIYGAI